MPRPRLPPQPHNVLIFVADGLRADSVNAKDAPTLWKWPARRAVHQPSFALSDHHDRQRVGDRHGPLHWRYRQFRQRALFRLSLRQTQNAAIAILENDATWAK